MSDTKIKLIIIALSVFLLSIPLFINPLIVDNYPKQGWDIYVLVFVVFPVLFWFMLGFAVNKMKEQNNNNNNITKK